ncbi:MAG TPA: hypothetical protein PLP33_07205 [Leptospiraceae bacterium]|nr:hypothetical protein [Leptospiraceae bacterium]
MSKQMNIGNIKLLSKMNSIQRTEDKNGNNQSKILGESFQAISLELLNFQTDQKNGIKMEKDIEKMVQQLNPDMEVNIGIKMEKDIE